MQCTLLLSHGSMGNAAELNLWVGASKCPLAECSNIVENVAPGSHYAMHFASGVCVHCAWQVLAATAPGRRYAMHSAAFSWIHGECS